VRETFIANIERYYESENVGEYLDSAMRDKFIFGLRHKSINKLLDKNRTFPECIKIPLAEAAEREVDLVRGQPDQAVHSTQPAARHKFYPHPEHVFFTITFV
jgi:hypothetical protein